MDLSQAGRVYQNPSNPKEVFFNLGFGLSEMQVHLAAIPSLVLIGHIRPTLPTRAGLHPKDSRKPNTMS